LKKRLSKLWKSGSNAAASQADRALEHTCAGRVVNALTFIVVIFCLGLWITVFLLLNQFLAQNLSTNWLTYVTCFIFFGGLVVTLFVGTLAGNFLRRTFWTMLVKRF